MNDNENPNTELPADDAATSAPEDNAATAENPALQQAQEQLSRLRQEISRAVIGQHEVIDQLLVGLLAGGHVLLEGVPGLGKTLLARALAKCVGGDAGRVQFTPDLMPADVTGHAMLQGGKNEFTIRKGPIFCNFLLADEINRAPAKTQAALLEAMQELQVTIEGQSMELEQPMMVLATQNPVELEGTYPLPEAQLDRFLLKIRLAYPKRDEEGQLVRMVTGGRIGNVIHVDHLAQIIDLDTVQSLQQATAELHMDDAVVDYAIDIVRITRDGGGMLLGSGPRGSIALIRAARAQAMLAGRSFVTPDDVKQIAKPALRHRLLLAAELEMEGRDIDHVLDELIERIPAPRQ